MVGRSGKQALPRESPYHARVSVGRRGQENRRSLPWTQGPGQQQQNQTRYPTEIYLGQSSPSHRGLTVDDVIRMSQGGVSEDVILKQIRKKGQRLDLSTNDILKLKNAGVSSRVISAMLGPNGPVPSSAPVSQVTVHRSGPPGSEPQRTPVSTTPQSNAPENGVTAVRPPTMPLVTASSAPALASPASPPAHNRVHHNNSACPPGRDIPSHERRQGTAGYRLCDDCAKFNNQRR